MRVLVGLAVVALGSIASAQIIEARQLAANPLDTTQMRRSIQLIGAGDAVTKRLLIEHWTRDGQKHRDYLTALGWLHTEPETFRSASQRNRKLISEAVEAIVKVAETKSELGDFALRRLVWTIGSAFTPIQGHDVFLGCGVGIPESFASVCKRARADKTPSIRQEHCRVCRRL